MNQVFKHPQVFADLLTVFQMYYPMHQNLPKPLRLSVGERVLQELTQCLRLVVLANGVDKQCPQARSGGAAYLRELRAGVEVVRGMLLLCWKMKALSHGALTALAVRLESVSKQAARWQQWFELAPG